MKSAKRADEEFQRGCVCWNHAPTDTIFSFFKLGPFAINKHTQTRLFLLHRTTNHMTWESQKNISTISDFYHIRWRKHYFEVRWEGERSQNKKINVSTLRTLHTFNSRWTQKGYVSHAPNVK